MKRDGVIIISEKNERHFNMIRNGLLRAGVNNNIMHLADGRQSLDFLYEITQKTNGELDGREYILFMDIDLPDVSGIEILEKIKADNMLSKIPVVVLTEKDDPWTIDHCYDLGCCTYVVKPAEGEIFEDSIKKIGSFLSVVKITPLR